MAIPDYQKLMLPVLAIAAEGETRVPLAAEKSPPIWACQRMSAR
jgi:hypothetical protein